MYCTDMPMKVCFEVCVVGTLPTMIEDGFEEIIGISHSRRNMVDFLHENGFKRPEYNLIRNSKLRTMTKTQLRGSTDGYKKINTDDEYFHPV